MKFCIQRILSVYDGFFIYLMESTWGTDVNIEKF